MSGHSRWSKVKHKKTATDAAKSKTFSKMAKEITIAAKEGGPDPNFNSKLRIAIEKAKFIRLPAENIKKAIERGSGKTKDDNLESFTFEAYGPEGIAIIIEGITDNKNRALGEVKQILSKHKAKLTGEGGARWLFERKTNKEDNTLEWVPKQKIETDKEIKKEFEKLFEELDETDSVQEIYSNIKLP